MNIAIRVDASIQIGTGHFMRCLTLADALRQRGAQVRFVCRNLPDYLRDMLAAKGHEYVLLISKASHQAIDELAHSSWLGVSQTQDAEDSIRALADQDFDWVVVDHYGLDARWETKLRAVSQRILVIDDIADRQHNCDALLDQNHYSNMQSRYLDRVPPNCKLFLGPRYSLLRDEFQELHQQVKPRSGSVKKILVFFGGMDANNVTGQAIKALYELAIREVDVDVVIGAQHPALDSIQHDCLQYHFRCHMQTAQMAELMASADLAIGAGGSAIWERCCLGLPTITICTADNQRDQIAGAASEGWIYAPDNNVEVGQLIKRHVSALTDNRFIREHISSNALQAVDGYGVLRVITTMGCHEVEMRVAIWSDSEDLFNWRNHPSIRAVSRNNELISWEDHSQWFAGVLNDSNRILLIGQHQGLPVGVVRFDIQNDQAEVSIYLVPESNNKGRGGDLLQSAESWIAQHYPEIKGINAIVLGDNPRSHRLFLSAGYEIKSTSYFKRLQV